MNEPKSTTIHGNTAGPGYVKITEWITSIWNNFDSNLIKKSFKYCGITSINKEDYHSQLKGLNLVTVLQYYNMTKIFGQFLFL